MRSKTIRAEARKNWESKDLTSEERAVEVMNASARMTTEDLARVKEALNHHERDAFQRAYDALVLHLDSQNVTWSNTDIAPYHLISQIKGQLPGLFDLLQKGWRPK